ncbi:hypothetical protein GCK72_008006 [Caenorhabditis remanei]|uniref:F-box associated domain-containing protein n=1 Tax=Caenorhabditis remanei TaxID=31234 RepID=A0A6A5HKI7_CAERE|nr:hypothetical protein GCK72_008006 [Caenorhabditis remanei]KAF1768045.1 hypothetical protein GCK72_008006 [Caenorhabditis remanei]
MPPPLSYPALKLVLEYLEANKRSALQKIDYLIPLRAGNLTAWKDYRVSLDELEYSADYKHVYINWKTDREEYELLKVHVAKKKLMKKYLEGRPNIHVGCVHFNYVKGYEQVPLKLNLITNKLETFCCSVVFTNFLPILDARSFPLKKLEIAQENTIDIDHPVVNTTEDVILQFIQPNEPMNGIEKLQRKKLTIQNIMDGNVDAVKIIKDWMNNGREVGTEYLLSFSFDIYFGQTLRDLKKEFNEFQNMKGINGRFLRGASRFLIPMSPTSKIIIYGTRIQSKGNTVYQLVLKVVSTD